MSRAPFAWHRWSPTSGRASADRAFRQPARRSGSTAAAFTLIEVLVSLAIFALAAVVLGAAYVNVLTGYDAVARRQEHEEDLRLVRSQILAEPDRAVVEQGGNFNLPDARVAQWTAAVGETSVADLFKVALRCEIPEPGRSQPWVREESFLLLRPTWSDPAVRDRLRQQSAEKLQKRTMP
jgi:general secretion pathway protein I